MNNISYLKRKNPLNKKVNDKSLVLLRLGEICNFKCPMCPISGENERFIHASNELIRRVDYLCNLGFKQFVLTGGEPTIHPGFIKIIERINAHGIPWDINTNASSFVDNKLVLKCKQNGLRRSIVSLHSHLDNTSATIFGTSTIKVQNTISGTANLSNNGIEVLLNYVLNKHNYNQLSDYLEYVSCSFPRIKSVKFAFPNGMGIGKSWNGLKISYSEIKPYLIEAKQTAKDVGINIFFEGIPNCIHLIPTHPNYGRSQFGETHYLDEVSGKKITQIDQLEVNSSVFSTKCARCSSAKFCSGITSGYFQKYGFDELVPF